MDALVLVFSFALGAIIGSFSNVLIYRVPRGENIAFPPSRCPKCGRRLGALDLVPILSWVGLRGRCRSCRNPISARYPIVELASAVGYAAIAWRFPPLEYGLATIGLWFAFTVLLVSAAIDLDTKTLPDALTLPAVAVGLLFALVRGPSAVELPDFNAALHGALVGAGLLSLISGFGAWALRRFREPRHPDFPVGFPQVHLAALAGAWLGPWGGLVVAAASVAANLVWRRAVRVPDALTLGGLLVTLVVTGSGFGPGLVWSAQGALLGAGAAALLAGLYWAFQPDPEVEPDDADPIAMGFGDVKLAAAIGAFLAWQGLVVGLAAAIVIGAVGGIIGRLMGGDREVPFGPYLAAGALFALFAGPGLLEAYLRSVGL